MQDLNDMVIFAKVVQAGGFTSAADVLGLPKSNVSRRVARLEESLGIRLLERTTRKIRVTEIGRIYYQHCLRIIEESEHADLSVQAMLAEPRGVLKVSASVATGQQLLAPILSDFLSRYPHIQLDLELSNRRVDLIEEGVDVAIRVGALSDSRLVSRRLGKSQHYFYASDSYLKQHGPVHTLEELTSHRLLIMSDMLNTHNELSVITEQDQQPKKLTVTPYCRVNDFQTLHQLATSGAGIALLPHYLCQNQDRCLPRVLPQWCCLAVDFSAVYPSHRGATPKLRVFLDFIYDRLQRYLIT